MESRHCRRRGGHPPGWLPPPHVMDGWGARPLRWLSVLVFQILQIWMRPACTSWMQVVDRQNLPDTNIGIQSMPCWHLIKCSPTWMHRWSCFQTVVVNWQARCADLSSVLMRECRPNDAFNPFVLLQKLNTESRPQEVPYATPQIRIHPDSQEVPNVSFERTFPLQPSTPTSVPVWMQDSPGDMSILESSFSQADLTSGKQEISQWVHRTNRSLCSSAVSCPSQFSCLHVTTHFRCFFRSQLNSRLSDLRQPNLGHKNHSWNVPSVSPVREVETVPHRAVQNFEAEDDQDFAHYQGEYPEDKLTLGEAGNESFENSACSNSPWQRSGSELSHTPDVRNRDFNTPKACDSGTLGRNFRSDSFGACEGTRKHSNSSDAFCERVPVLERKPLNRGTRRVVTLLIFFAICCSMKIVWQVRCGTSLSTRVWKNGNPFIIWPYRPGWPLVNICWSINHHKRYVHHELTGKGGLSSCFVTYAQCVGILHLFPAKPLPLQGWHHRWYTLDLSTHTVPCDVIAGTRQFQRRTASCCVWSPRVLQNKNEIAKTKPPPPKKKKNFHVLTSRFQGAENDEQPGSWGFLSAPI